MHPPVFEFVAKHLPIDITSKTTVVEFGSRDINGNVNALLGQAKYYGVDLVDGNNVTDVCDAREWDLKADIVLCLELLEHCEDVDGVIFSIIRNLKAKGTAIVTCATDPRSPHSAADGGALQGDEHYKNVSFKELNDAVKAAGGKVSYKEIDAVAGDLRVVINVN